MATALAAQLDQLAAGREEQVRGRVSLLYNPQQAADVDLHTIYAGAASGAWQRRGHRRTLLRG